MPGEIVALLGALELGRLLVAHDGARRYQRVVGRQRLEGDTLAMAPSTLM